MDIARWNQYLKRWLIAAGWVYFTLLLVWAALYLLAGDQMSVLALFNNIAVYLFWPIPAMILLAAWVRRWEITLGCVIGGLLFGALWGDLFLPRLQPREADGDQLVVMTYNVLGRHDQAASLQDTIRQVDPDVVLIQELNPAVADALNRDLKKLYPYQVLQPETGVTGMGVLSKFPLRSTGVALPLEWVGHPQVLAMDWGNQTVTLVNFHMFPSGLGTQEQVAYVYRAREDQARALAEFARTARTPLVAAGDANITPLADAYQILTGELRDAWREAGFGLGHTFPGSAIPGSSRPRLAGRPVPMWLARIDYIFFSDHWQAASARVAPFDGYSDHRAVVAELVLVKP